MELSNFYKEYSSDYSQFEALFAIYNDLMLLLNQYVVQVKNNGTIPKMETYRTIPFQRLNVIEATYSLNEILENIEATKKLNIDNLPLNERIERWTSGQISDQDKINVLDSLERYILLVSRRNFIDEIDSDIIDFDLFDDNNNLLIRNFDYAFINNKIYLLSENTYSVRSKYFVMTNIAVDYNTPESLGKSVNVKYTDKISKNEYNEIIQMLMYAALGGPTIKNLKNAIKSISGFDKAELYDKYITDKNKQKRWADYKLSDFDFIVVFPEEHMADPDKVNILVSYLRLIKPAYVRFFVLLQSLYSEIYNPVVNANDSNTWTKIIFSGPSHISRLNNRSRLNMTFKTWSPAKSTTLSY